MGNNYKERHLHIERRVTSVNTYVNCIFQICEGDAFLNLDNIAGATAYFFRGQANAEWCCESTAHRKLRNNSIESLKNYHEDLISNARKYKHHYKNGRELHDLELLGELRHYGAATWLLDLTFDPLVALFFACQSLEESGLAKDGAVYVFNKSLLYDQLIDISAPGDELLSLSINDSIGRYFDNDDNIDECTLFYWDAKRLNERMQAQSGLFLFGRAGVNQEVEFSGECILPFIKLIIDRDAKQTILMECENIFGLDRFRVYPDFSGFAEGYNTEIRIRRPQ